MVTAQGQRLYNDVAADNRPQDGRELMKHRRRSETYGVLTWLLGILGINRVYLGQYWPMVLRCTLLVSTVVTGLFGLAFVSVSLLGAAMLGGIASLSFWFYDLATQDISLYRYHGRVEKRLIRQLERVQHDPICATKAVHDEVRHANPVGADWRYAS